MDIDRSSRLIGEFMGGEFISGEGKVEDRISFKDNWYYMPLAYHKDWNSLIEVCKKIESIIIDEDIAKQYRSDEMLAYDRITSGCSSFDIKEVHSGVISFINFYNKK